MLSGVNSDLRQQLIITDLLVVFYNKLKGIENIKVTPESDIVFYDNNNYQRKNADLVIWKYSNKQLNGITEPLLLFELTNIKFPIGASPDNNKDVKKMYGYISNIKSLRECFLYNYDTKNILKFSKNNRNTVFVSLDDYSITSSIFNINLKHYLHNFNIKKISI